MLKILTPRFKCVDGCKQTFSQHVINNLNSLSCPICRADLIDTWVRGVLKGAFTRLQDEVRPTKQLTPL